VLTEGVTQFRIVLSLHESHFDSIFSWVRDSKCHRRRDSRAIDMGYGWLARKCRQWAVKRLMGADFDRNGQYHIVYGSLMSPTVRAQNGKEVSHPYAKTPLPPPQLRQRSSATFSIEHPVSSCDMRACAYLAQLFGKAGACAPFLDSDNDVVSRVDLSFISLGGARSNYKTEDALAHPVNSLLSISTDNLRFVNPGTQTPVTDDQANAEYDYGMILRICPT
jgi:hypothetical protein